MGTWRCEGDQGEEIKTGHCDRPEPDLGSYMSIFATIIMDMIHPKM